jgi:hypothetical protein
VFRLLTAGLTVTEIGAQLQLAPNTVSTYRVRILEKTGTKNDVELALYAESARPREGVDFVGLALQGFGADGAICRSNACQNRQRGNLARSLQWITHQPFTRCAMSELPLPYEADRSLDAQVHADGCDHVPRPTTMPKWPPTPPQMLRRSLAASSRPTATNSWKPRWSRPCSRKTRCAAGS